MNFGINTFLFVSPFTNESVSLFPKFKEWGFDSVEIALEDPSHIDAAFVKKALDENGLKCCSICPAMGPDRDLRGDAQQQKNSINYIKGILDAMVVLDCPVLIGPLYSSVGRASLVEKEEYKKQWSQVVPHLRDLAAYAGSLNKNLAIEPLNRYETDFINTADQALKMVADVNHPNLLVHLDSYHMNIEEKDSAKAILRTGNKLGHFHACGCDRGTPGNDHINWKDIAAALREVNYDGNVVIESFLPKVEVIAKAASIWRDFEPSQEDIAIKGVKFLKSIL